MKVYGMVIALRGSNNKMGQYVTLYEQDLREAPLVDRISSLA